MITLYQFPGAWGLPSLSPFCTKVQAWMCAAELPFEARTGDVRRSPKGKLPYVRDGDVVVCDSSDIIDHYTASHGDPFGPLEDPRDQAAAQLVKRTVEESLYFCDVYRRWVDDAGWSVLRPVVAGIVPAFARPVVLPLIRSKVRRDVVSQGIGRHTRDQVFARAAADLDAVAGLLGDRPFLFGDDPRRVDCAVFPFLQSFVRVPIDSAPGAHARGLGNLVAYVERCERRFQPAGA